MKRYSGDVLECPKVSSFVLLKLLKIMKFVFSKEEMVLVDLDYHRLKKKKTAMFRMLAYGIPTDATNVYVKIE